MNVFMSLHARSRLPDASSYLKTLHMIQCVSMYLFVHLRQALTLLKHNPMNLIASPGAFPPHS
jgi:hypothetical protein